MKQGPGNKDYKKIPEWRTRIEKQRPRNKDRLTKTV